MGPSEQLRLEGINAPYSFRLRPATILLGKAGIAECRAVLAAAADRNRLTDLRQ